MILVDSSVWIDYFNGYPSLQTDTLDRLLTQNLIITGDIILAEVLQGFRGKNDYVAAKAALTLLPCFDLLGKHMAIRTVENYRQLRQRGITVRKTIDMFIATFCIEQQIPLLHCDKDFERISTVLPLVFV